jgi:hypothetical protein
MFSNGLKRGGKTMKQSVIRSYVALTVCLVVAFGSISYAAPGKADFDGCPAKAEAFSPQNRDENRTGDELKKGCLTATVTAIQLEVSRYQRWIDLRKQQGDQKGVAVLQESLRALQADLDKYTAMDAKEYVLPARVETVAWVEGKPGNDTIVYVEGMSKSGPWYHLAGIQGGDYAALQPGAKQQLNLYAVYGRSYGGMSSAYVFVDNSQQAPGKRISGEVFVRKNMALLADVVKCEKYQLFLLKDTKPGTKGELILDSKTSRFDVILSGDNLKNYSLIEFVSAYGSKTLNISELKDEPLTIILEREMYLKKPAIYLYPVQKSQIMLTHSFKGKVVSTYPAYTDNWTVIADPDGTLLNVKDQRTYQYLFWDGVYTFPAEHYQYQSGFTVKREDYVAFLQTKLAHIGLNEREINDFIVYWLPVMNKHKQCFVHFRINDNIGGSSVLSTQPAAETSIRVFMEFSGSDTISSQPNLPEQNLTTFIRKGFTLVEWGGAEIGSSKME